MTNEEAMVMLKKNPISFGCGALAFLLSVGIYLRSEALPDAEADLTQKSAAAERIASNLKYSAQLKEQFDALVAANAAVDARIVRASQLGANTQYFYKLESDTGVKILDLRQTTASVTKPAKGTYAPVGFSVTVQGTFAQVVEFLRQVENGAHYSRVLTASCSTNAGNRNAPLTLALSLDLLGLP
jgi:hypothetical protein